MRKTVSYLIELFIVQKPLKASSKVSGMMQELKKPLIS